MMRLIFWFLVATVCLSPLPFGSIYLWSYTLMAVVVGGLVLLWSVELLRTGRHPPVTPDMVWMPALLFGAVILWAWFQTAGWAPAAWQNPVWARTAAVLERPVAGTISVDPLTTRIAIMRLLTYAGIFWLALQFGRSDGNARNAFRAVALAGLAYAAYGLVVEFTGAKTILWFEKERYLDNLTSTFRYKNAYAAYAGLGLIATATLLVQEVGRVDFAVLGPRERLRTVIALMFGRAWHLVIVFILILSALMLSDSRGGFIAIAVALLGFVGLLWHFGNGQLRYGRAIFRTVLAIGIGYVLISGGTVFDRLGETSTDDIRTQIYRDTVTAIADRPLLGWGLGTFEGVFAKYQGPEYIARTLRAHNEYLDNALGLGIPATIALVAAIALIAAQCLRGVRIRRRNNVYPAAGVAVVLLVGTQSFVDFTMQEPAVAATFALLLGTSCAQSWSSLVRRITVPDS